MRRIELFISHSYVIHDYGLWIFRTAPANLDKRTTITIDDRTFVVEADDLEKICDLGHGAYGIVEKMRHRQTGTVMAVKRITATVNTQEQVDDSVHAINITSVMPAHQYTHRFSFSIPHRNVCLWTWTYRCDRRLVYIPCISTARYSVRVMSGYAWKWWIWA